MLGISRQRVRQLASDRDDFPKPAVMLKAGAVWERQAVEAWAERNGRPVRR